ncbi:MAG: serine hydrolase [Chitinophagaceae bacterium]|nr:serine hydrolase [Chitinophagaceae bacterium]
MKRSSLYFFLNLSIILSGTVSAQDKNNMNHTLKPDTGDGMLYNLLVSGAGQFDSILKHAADWKVQIICTQVDHLKKNKVKLTTHSFRNDPSEYFYPASTVKLPIAILALQKLRELKIPGLTMNSTMITEAEGPVQTAVSTDPSAVNGKPTIAQYIRKILLVSDNDAFNRLYEFLGQEYINRNLHRMGYTDTRIIHRLSIFLSEKDNRHTNPVRFLDDSGKLLYYKPAETSTWDYAQEKTPVAQYLMGKGFIRGDELVNQPFDFSTKNRMPLGDLHAILTSIIFPESVPAKQRFHLQEEDYLFLRKCMSILPRESKSPAYDTTRYGDNIVKFIYYGAASGNADTTIHIFNKPGDAYGFMTDAAYVADFKNKRDFLLSATIYCNSDSIFNDDHYDYDAIGFPFMRNLGRLIHEKEIHRTPTREPGWSGFLFNYKE